MQEFTPIGIDLGKHSFHVHEQGQGQDVRGNPIFRKKCTRKQLITFLTAFHPCPVVMEACAGTHHMARHLLTFGHQVKLIDPQFVRPFAPALA